MSTCHPPAATYRLQFNAGFTFADATRLIPYLHALGISHLYASPYLKARAGSHHGYDIVDHNALNPEIGSEQEFDTMGETLQRHGMGHILDMVPNHMGVGGSDNRWWLDVLENGPSSRYADYFDIDWYPVKQELHNKVLLPFLGGHYGDILEGGDLTLRFDPDGGAFSVWYYEHCFPVDPKTYPFILDAPGRDGGPPDEDAALKDLIGELEALPAHWRTDEDSRRRRGALVEQCKQRLARLYRERPTVRDFIDGCVASVNGTAGEPASFDRLHRLLEHQPYRLAYWQVASHEINYRRFFDINDLAGLRVENEEVFDATHRLVLQLIRRGRLQGLRIDHIDGLSDPLGYCRRLNEKIGAASGAAAPQGRGSCYLVVEKILASHEYLPQEWPVDGTTGYEFANLVNGLFVFPGAERSLSRTYRRFLARRVDFDELLYECKKLMVQTSLSSELNVLANQLNRISEADRHARDFTVIGLREGLVEIVAGFPVYRTYVTGDGLSTEDRRFVDWAVAQAKKRTPVTDIGVFDFIHKVLLLEWPSEGHGLRAVAVRFAMKFQQYTAPVMAKSLEDTAFYVYNRLVSLNEVGGDPRRYGVSMAAFHHLNQERLRRWPHAMLCTSTHDTKRGEDVRARIDVLSELGEVWRHRLGKWSRTNRRFKRRVDDVPCPARNDEYLLYQTLVGAWPLEEMDEQRLESLRGRIEEYMIKAAREAKVHTSWVKHNEGYEEAMRSFVGALLGRLTANPFLSDFMEFHRDIYRYGLYNSLAQVVLKLTVPGVPDIYQGNESWCFNLVDPDNRRPVDYGARVQALDELRSLGDASPRQRTRGVAALLHTLEDGRIKHYLTWRLLRLRRERPALFQQGDYVPLAAHGDRGDHVCAFLRRHGSEAVLVAVPRWFYVLCAGAGGGPADPALWRGTGIGGEDLTPCTAWTNLLTGERVAVQGESGKPVIPAPALFATLPFAVCVPAEARPETAQGS